MKVELFQINNLKQGWEQGPDWNYIWTSEGRDAIEMSFFF